MTILGLDTPFNTNPSDITNSSTDTSEPRRYSLGVGAVDSGTEGGGEEAKVAAAAGEEPDYYKKGSAELATESALTLVKIKHVSLIMLWLVAVPGDDVLVCQILERRMALSVAKGKASTS